MLAVSKIQAMHEHRGEIVDESDRLVKKGTMPRQEAQRFDDLLRESDGIKGQIQLLEMSELEKDVITLLTDCSCW